MKKRFHTLFAFTVTAAVASYSMTACSSSKSADYNYAIEETAAMYFEDASDMTMAKAAAASGQLENSMEVMGAEAGYDVLSSDSGLTSPNAIQAVTSNRKLIRTVNLSVETTEFNSLIDSINQTVLATQGYIEQSDISGTSISSSHGNRRNAHLTVRIPSNELDSFISQVGEQSNVINKSENTHDVTLQYSDIESRKKSLTIEQDRLWDLLAKADSVDSIIALEARLSEIRYQLESFESQLRTYDNQIEYSTVHLNINEVITFTPTAPDSVLTRIQKGFARNLTGISNKLVDSFVWFLSSLPTFVVLIVIVIVILGLTRLFLLSINKKKKAKEASQTQTADSSAEIQPEQPSPLDSSPEQSKKTD